MRDMIATVLLVLVYLLTAIFWQFDVWVFRESWYVFAFYATLIWVIHRFRSKFEWQNRIIGLYKTKVGLKLMDRWGKHTRAEKIASWVLRISFVVIYLGALMAIALALGLVSISMQLLISVIAVAAIVYLVAMLFRPVKEAGKHAVIAGFSGMLVIVIMLGKGIYDFLFVADALPVIAPVIPGVTVPGTNLHIPLIIGWLALFIVVVIHEFSHGVVARAHKVPVHSSGLMVFGPFAGAFVEPEEKKLTKQPKMTQLAVFAAGPYSNMITSLWIGLLLLLVVIPISFSHVVPQGVVFNHVDMPASEGGVQTDVVYTSVNGEEIANYNEFLTSLQTVAPGDAVSLETASGESHVFAAGTHPDNDSQGYLGVYIAPAGPAPGIGFHWRIFWWFQELLEWVVTLGLGIGLANLLPIGPVDGGRMFQLAATSVLGKKRGLAVWTKTSMVLLFVIVLLLLVAMTQWFV